MRKSVALIMIGIASLITSTMISVTPTRENLIDYEEIMTELAEEGVEVKELSNEDLIKAKLEKEYNANSQYDIAGVIYVEDWIFDVVMLPTENDDYLYASRDGEYLREGELFLSDLAEYTEDNRSLDMTRIYGHNMATGRKFGLLNRLLHKENARPMYFYDGVETRKYEAAKGFKFIDGTSTFERYDLTLEQKEAFLEDLTSNSIVSHQDGFDPEKETVFLQTCMTATGLNRYVIVYVEAGVI